MNVLLSIGNNENKEALLPFIGVASENNKNITFYATEKTYKFLKENKITSILTYKISQLGKYPNVSELISKQQLDVIINIPSRDVNEKTADYTDGEIIRKTAAELGIIPITDIDVAEIILGNLGGR